MSDDQEIHQALSKQEIHERTERNHRDAKTDNDETLVGLARRIRRLEEDGGYK